MFVRKLFFCLATLLTPLAIACGSAPGASACQSQCDCESCADHELTKCINDTEELDALGAESGCSDAVNALLACLDGSMVCRAGVATVRGCERESAIAKACLRN